MSEFASKSAETLLEKLDPTAFLPAVFFGAASTALLIHSELIAWTDLNHFLNDKKTLLTVVLGVLGAHIILADASGRLLRFLEGYHWNLPILRHLYSWRVSKLKSESAAVHSEIRQLLTSNTHDGEIIRSINERIAILQETIDRQPSDDRMLPTKLGNLLRSAEDYSAVTYGISGIRAWPRLWHCLPAHARSSARAARRQLDRAVESLSWSVLYCLWAFVVPGRTKVLPIAISIIASFALYRRLLNVADSYGVMIRTCYDLYRFDLYKQLRVPAPRSPHEELKLAQINGSTINNILYSQPFKPTVLFSPSGETKDRSADVGNARDAHEPARNGP